MYAICMVLIMNLSKFKPMDLWPTLSNIKGLSSRVKGCLYTIVMYYITVVQLVPINIFSMYVIQYVCMLGPLV
jgi:hypothetical protein